MTAGGCVVRSVWLAMAILAWTQSHTVTGFQSLDSPLRNHSPRLAELLRIASRLNQQNLARQKRLAQINDPVNIDVDSAQSPERFLNRKTRNVHGSSKSVEPRLERKRRGASWDLMYNNYKIFHTELSSFISQFFGRVKPGSPPELQYMRIVPDILPLDDPDFTYQDEDKVVDRIFTIMKFMARILRGARQYVQDSSLNWFDSQKEQLRLFASLITMSLAHVRLADDTEFFNPVDAGVGDINLGFLEYRPITVAHLEELLAVI
ncbi:hypothetical protein RRG08_016979 [Elysia crispata]|uniref:Uncharacterized protein n=1 Tax=Elysia crispata TaxID=231223 RepID=A0AAE0XYU3_9GAST|nr:hypothetical protein RRG08_016979 [Elysia crispata]